jgi:hypothetical protein
MNEDERIQGSYIKMRKEINHQYLDFRKAMAKAGWTYLSDHRWQKGNFEVYGGVAYIYVEVQDNDINGLDNFAHIIMKDEPVTVYGNAETVYGDKPNPLRRFLSNDKF